MGPWYDQHASDRHHAEPPPIGPDGSQVELPAYGLVKWPHARRLQAGAVGEALRALARAPIAALATARMLISCAGAGAAKRAPDRLTSTCR